MKFPKLKSALCLLASASCLAALPASAQLLGGNQVNIYAPVSTGFSNCPTVMIGIAAGASQTNLTASYTNAVRLRPGRDLGLAAQLTGGSNTVGGLLFNFGLVYNRTNTCTITNFTWTVNVNGTTAVRNWTNIPNSIVGNADGVFLHSVLDTGTNSITGIKLFAQQQP